MTHTTPPGSAAMPITADGRRCLRRLRALAERLDQQAALVRNGGYDTTAERRAGRWNGEAPAPALSDAIIDATSLRYCDAYKRLTGKDIAA